MLGRLSRFLSEPPSLRRTTALRIGLGLVGLIAYVHILPSFFFIYGEHGLAAGAHLFPWGLDNRVQTIVLVLLLGSSLGMIFSVSARATTALLWFAHSWLWLSNSSYYWSWGLLFSDLLFLLIFFPSSPRAAPRGAGVGFWFRMFQVQVCFVYLLACLYRYDSPLWLRGEALHVALADTVFGRFTFFDWYSYYPFTAVFSYAGFAVEWMGGLFLLFHKRLGPYVVLGLTGLHLTLQLTTMVQAWQFLMITALVAFWPEAWLVCLEARMHAFKSRLISPNRRIDQAARR